MTQEHTALITGAAGDIGSEVAKRFYEMGYRLILIDIDQQLLNTLSHDFHNAITLVVDLTDRDKLNNLIEKIKKDYGHIDIAFINAGAVCVGNIVDMDEKQIDLQLELNLRSAVHLIKACAHNMVAHGGGHIIATVSMGGIVSLKGSAAYSASKFGLRGFMAGIRDELKPYKVNISGIYPTGVDSKMLRYEATHGGSLLNFVSVPVTVKDVGDAVIKAIKSKHLELYVPYSESLSGRFISCFPWMISYLYPLLEWFGRRGRNKYLKQI